MSDARQKLGLKGEKLAERFLRRKRYKTLARRYSAPCGEIDLIMRDGDTVVFVEVKTQTNADLTRPEARVNTAKQQKLAHTALVWLKRKDLLDRACRFDVVAVIVPARGRPTIEHFPDAFVPQRWV